MVGTAQITSTTVERLTAEAVQEGGYTSVSQAARIMGATAPSTAFRKIQRGVTLQDGSRIFLEAIRSGKKWLTTKSAVKRFLEAQQDRPVETPPALRSPAARRKASESASARADAMLA